MKQVKLVQRVFAAALFGAAAGCGAESLDTSVDSLEGRLDITWARCADQGEFCAFQGTRRVRFSVNASQYEIEATDGVQCSPRSFGVTRHWRRKDGAGYCEVGTQSAPASGGGHAGSAAPQPMPSTAAGASAPSAPSMSGSGMSGMSGPHIDASALPVGSPGVSTPLLEPTSEKPGPSDGTGAFRTVCSYSHMNFDDPIVFPGQPGKSHLHAFFGNTQTDAFSTAESLASTGNSTCRGGTINRSGYWAPALIDAAGKPIAPLSLEVYYKSGYGGIAPSAIKPFPQGLRMVAGNAKSTSTQSVAYWGCREHYVGKPGSIPSCNAGENIAMIVEFPQCWDGKNLDSSDHKSHMAYPRNGACPATHPVPIPAITLNVIYANPGKLSGVHLASDMYDASLPGGFSAHADWFGGWDPAIVKTFVSKCINPALDCHSHLLGDGRAMR